MDSFRLTRRHVVGNIAVLFSGSALANALTIFTLLLIARHFGAEEYGKYSASLALASLSSILFSLGLDTWLLREGGRQPKELSVSLGSVLAIKAVGGGLWLVLIVVLAPLINQSAFPADLLRLLAVTVLLDSLFATTLTGFKASLRNNYTSILEAASDAAWLAVTAALIFAGIQQINTFVYGRGLVLLASVGLAFAILSWLIGLRARREMTNKALHEAFPYASSEFLAWVAMRGDVIIIGFALGGYAAGIYSPAVGIVNGLFLVPASVYMVMVPVLSNLYAQNPTQARVTSKRMLLLLMLTGAILSAGLFIIAPLLISFLSESFQESLGIIRILSVILLLKSGSYGMAAILVATGQQSSRTVVQVIVVALNISLNLLVVSRYGVSGVAVVYVISEVVLLAGYSWLVYRQRGERLERKPILSGEEKNHPWNNTDTSIATRVLILNVHSSSNAGDAALAWMTLELLKGQFADLRATLSMDDPASHSGEGQAIGSLIAWLKTDPRAGMPRWKKWNLVWLLPATLLPLIGYRLAGRPVLVLTPKRLRKLVMAFTQADLVVSQAGGFLYHSGSGLTLLIALYSLMLAILAGKAVYIFPQSIGPFKKKWERTLAGWVLNRARLVMLREPISLEEVKRCGVRAEKCLLLPDLAFGFQSAPVEKAEAWLAAQGIDTSRERPLLGITVINWGAQNPTFSLQSNYEEAVARAVSYFLDNYGGSAVFIPQVWGPLPSQDDRLPARRIRERLEGYPGRVHLVEEPLSPELLKAVYGRMDLFIGTRMHSNIFALSEGVPVIAIGYQHKTQGIARSLGLEEWVMDISQIDEKKLSELISKLYGQSASLRKQLQVQIPAIVEQSRTAGQIVAADYARLRSGEGHG